MSINVTKIKEKQAQEKSYFGPFSWMSHRILQMKSDNFVHKVITANAQKIF